MMVPAMCIFPSSNILYMVDLHNKKYIKTNNNNRNRQFNINRKLTTVWVLTTED